jgi:murein DD-endopeptidase MepM/ murein hydrolase activator NlpD
MMFEQDRSGLSFGAKVRHVFRERELYIRSEGTVRFVVIRPWFLVCTALLAFGGLVWAGITTTSFALREHAISQANSRTHDVRVSYEDRIADIQDLVDGMNDRLMLDQDAYLSRVDTLRGEFAELLRRHRRLEIFFEQGWMEPAENDASAAPGDADTDGDQSESQREGWWRPQDAPEFSTAEEAERPLHELRIIFADLIVQQHTLLDQVVELGESRAEKLRIQVRSLGLNPQSVASSIDAVPNATGGPLLPVQNGEQPRDSLDERILEAHQRFSEAEKLLFAINRMPIRLPIETGYRLTSGFGFRADPFSNVVAMHAGVDLRAALGTPVENVADGVVLRAEHADAYGKVIDIEHDNGIVSRYAHLSQINVVVGDRVLSGQVIGLVGSTGRSTGPHLHYETRVDGRPIDPYQFLRVARNVLQEEN